MSRSLGISASSGTPRQLELELEPIADGVIVRPHGEIDINSASSFRAHLTSAQRGHPARMVIDMVNVPWIDSAVVATLVQTLRAARIGSTMLVLCNLQQRVQSLLEIVGLADGVFTITDSLDEAVALPNRRKFERFGHDGLKCSCGKVLDISAGGLKVRSKKRLRGRVELTLQADGVKVALEAQAVWSIRVRWRHYESGLQFASLGVDDARKLALIVDAAGEQSSRRKRKPT